MNSPNLQSIAVSSLQSKDIAQAIELVLRTFHRFVGNEYEPAGVREFERYVSGLAARLQSRDYAVLVTKSSEVITGLLEIRNPDHISLLFVDSERHGQGIAKALWAQALAKITQARPDITSIDVNSSRFAVAAYEKLGFRVAGSFTVRNGIGFIPMTYSVRR